MSQQELEQRFVARVRHLLTTLPYDLKVLFEAMSDEDLPREVRELAAGAVIYCLSPSDPIPDSMGLVGFVDDLVIVRLVMAKMLELGGDAIEDYPKRFEEHFSALESDVELLRSYFGEALQWVEQRLEKLPHAKHKGKKVSVYVEDDEAGQRLYEDGLEFTTEYEIDDDAAAKLTSGEPVLRAFRQRNNVELARRSR